MRAKLFAAAALLAVVATACSSDNMPSGSSTQPDATLTATPPSGGSTVVPPPGNPGGGGAGGEQNVITVGNNLAFSPVRLEAKITAATGVTVTWRNTGEEQHAVTFDDNSFNQQLPPGGQVQFTFTQPSVTDYHCAIHPAMKGRINVST